MLAFCAGDGIAEQDLASQVGRSLGMVVGLTAPTALIEGALFAALPQVNALPSRARRARHRLPPLRPHRTSSGRIVLFHGWIDRQPDLAARLGCSAADPAVLYGAAVERWGDLAEREVEGNYCAIVYDPRSASARLSRSGLAAPPLHYFHRAGRFGAASVPRVLELLGVERRLNRRKLIDALYFNPVEEEGFLAGTWRVGLGQVVHLAAGGRRTVTAYDPLAVPLGWRRGDPRALIEECDRLIEEACREALIPARAPATTLTGGLDSSNIAARLLRVMGPEARLPTLTYVPLAHSTQPAAPHCVVDESAAVRAFAALHPQLEPHFIDNAAAGFDHRLDQLHAAMGTGQTCTVANFRYHGIFARAAELGCDWVFTAQLGAMGFSAPGDWAYGEFLRRGEWAQLVEALRADSWGGRSLLRKLLSRAVVPSLPLPLWRAWKSLRAAPPVPVNRSISALTTRALAEEDVIARARARGVSYERDQYGYRHEAMVDHFARGDIESADWIQAMEQLHDVRLRDVPCYRPLLEFCLSLPSEMFLREGQTRWLARELGRGIMPEAQRLALGDASQTADWHARLTPRLAELRRTLHQGRADPALDFIDFDLLESAIDNWPAESVLDGESYFLCAYTLPRAIGMIRYVQFMTGRNAEP